MFWNSNNRPGGGVDDFSDDDESPIEYRQSRSKKSSQSSSWVPFFFGGSNATASKKSRRRDKTRSNICKGPSSKYGGLALLGVLLLVYLFSFFRFLRQSRSSPRSVRTNVTPHVRHGPPRIYTPPHTHPSVAIASRHTRAYPRTDVGDGDSFRGHPSSSWSRRKAQTNSLIAATDTGQLKLDVVKEHYRRLAKHYLKSFTGGIYRQLFFDVLRRRTYALTPPGANKGVQCILFQVINKRVYMMDPYEVPRNSKPFYRTRINEVIWILSRLAEEGRIRDTEFLMAIHDCVQTVNKPHRYRGAHYQESNPTFTIVACNFSNNIPFPMWEGADRDGGFFGWDSYVKAYASDSTPWTEKKPAAVFRGSNRPSMYFQRKDDADRYCNSVGRTRLMYLQKENPDFFDVSVGGRCGGHQHVLQRLSPREHHQFKYIMYMEGNCGWADRLRLQIFGPSAIIKQETPCRQFFEPLMGAMVHYIPTNFFLTDTVDMIQWARAHDDEVRRIIKNANEFADNFLTRGGIEAYVEVLLDEYTKLLVEPDIKLENGAVDVTHKRV